MHGDEGEKDRNEHRHTLLNSAQVQDDQDEQDDDLRSEAVSMPRLRQDAEDLIDPGSHGDRDREDVIHDERISRDDAEARTEQLGRDEIAASSSGEELDHL